MGRSTTISGIEGVAALQLIEGFQRGMLHDDIGNGKDHSAPDEARFLWACSTFKL
jgi:hypothetical protein